QACSCRNGSDHAHRRSIPRRGLCRLQHLVGDHVARAWPALAVGGIATTKKACPAPAMQFEQAFLRALFDQPVWDIVNGMLEVKSASGTISFSRGL
ncbi:MAG: hypothetical protein RL735_197, partial [Pseudomonadota bacterium]